MVHKNRQMKKNIYLIITR